MIKVSERELISCGLQALSNIGSEQYFNLSRYQTLLKHEMNEFYDTDTHSTRLKNQSYRVLKRLEAMGKVIRVSEACANNAKYFLVENGVSQRTDNLEPKDDSLPLSEERLYKEQLDQTKAELGKLVLAHKDLLQELPAHTLYLNEEISKLESQISILEYKAIIVSKLITNELNGKN